MLRLIDGVRGRQRTLGLRPFLLIGLRKQGQAASAVQLPYRWPEKRLGDGPPPGPELTLLRGSIVPVLLAHRHASISLVPGGQVLDVASILRFGGARRGGTR